MTLPIAMTTISVLRDNVPDSEVPVEDDDSGYDKPRTPMKTWAPIATGVRAVISPNRSRVIGPGQTQVSELVMTCDPTDLTHLDRIRDETTGVDYTVTWALPVPAPMGLDHTQAGLSLSTRKA